ncbi:MAG TPA: dihydropteroate synthase, partial [Chloroflexota bacterium]
LLADDYEAVVQIARTQADEGAHALDMCCALTERTDESDQMRELTRRLAAAVEVPLVIDSTEPEVVQVALEHYPGRPIVNSVHLGEADRLHKVLPLVRDHGAAVIAMCIGPDGMAKTADRKLAVARDVHDLAIREYGLRPDALIFDTLTFPLSTGQEDLADSAVQTIDAIRAIKRELPGVLTVLGVSNVSFGLSAQARPLLNSMFLHHALAAGLDLAIVHPSHVLPLHEIPAEERELAEDLIFQRRPDALPRFIAHFEGADGPHPASPSEEGEEQQAVEERIHNRILHRKRAGIEALLDEAMQSHTPVEVLNEVLLPAMKHVGDLFGAGELILPYVLQSAEVMKAAVAHLEQFLEKREGYTKGKVVLATVFGDVHDIGKNLVATILSNNGYSVYDLGKQVPINQIIDKAVEVGADAIGLSALLVSTSKQMPLCVEELHRRGLDIPVLVGGAAINPRFGHRILFVDDGQPYAPGVFYNKDAFEGLASMDALTDAERRGAFVETRVAQARKGLQDEERRRLPTADSRLPIPARSAIEPVSPPTPPFWGARVLDGIDLDELFQAIDRRTLFALHWGGSKKHGAEREQLFREEFEPLLASLWAECTANGLIAPWAAYGYFHASADGDTLDVEGRRFEFPRQPANERLCLSDYFGADDVAALQLVTVGGRVSRRIEELQAAGEYSQMYFLHGLGVSTAEAVAEYVHRRVQRELGLPEGQGKRYSWGYPACPDLSQHQLVFNLLPARSHPDVDLTELYELVPEQSTAALVVHHPKAVYFAMHDADR